MECLLLLKAREEPEPLVPWRLGGQRLCLLIPEFVLSLDPDMVLE
jgi:hypothetical protein